MKKYIRIGIIVVAIVIVVYILFTIYNIKNQLEEIQYSTNNIQSELVYSIEDINNNIIQYSTNNIQSELVYSIEDINNNIRNTLHEELGD